MSIASELFPAKAKRPCRLSERERYGRRVRIRQIQPWKWSTGPKTPMGKRRSSQNHLIHGLFSHEFLDQRSAYVAVLAMVRRATK